MCQLRALLNEMWGEAEATKPKLRVIGGANGAKEVVTETRQEQMSHHRPLALRRLQRGAR